jgi:hypothetical protein
VPITYLSPEPARSSPYPHATGISGPFSTALSEVSLRFFLNCKANVRVLLAKTGHWPALPNFFIVMYVPFCVFCVKFVCKCVLYCTVLYCTALYCTVLYCIVLCCAVLYCTVLYCTVLHCIVLCCTVLCCAVLYCTVLYCTVLCCVVLYCVVLYCTVLYSTVLYCAVLLPLGVNPNAAKTK